MGGTMRLGSRRTLFKVPDCKSAQLWENDSLKLTYLYKILHIYWNPLRVHSYIICIISFSLIVVFHSRYGNETFVDERHRHRYEVCMNHGMLFVILRWFILSSYDWCSSSVGQSWYDIRTWSSWSVVCWKRWKWSADGGKLHAKG